MKEKLLAYRGAATAYLQKLSDRERLIIVLAGAMIVGFASVSAYNRVKSIFEVQVAEREQLDRDLQSAGLLLERYSKLKARRNEIENLYKEVEVKEGALSYLERLIREKAGVPTGFTIKEGAVRQFGGNYEQQPFSVKFPINSLEKLVEFLEELVRGPQKMILSRLNLKKSRSMDRLDVDIEVSSFKRVK